MQLPAEDRTMTRGSSHRRSKGRATIERADDSSLSTSGRESEGSERRRRRAERESASQQRQEEMERMHQVLMAMAKDSITRKIDTEKQFRQVAEQQKSTAKTLEALDRSIMTLREEQVAVKSDIQNWLTQMFTAQGRGQEQLPWHDEDTSWAAPYAGDSGRTVVANNHRHNTSKARSPVTFHCDTINATTMHLGPTNMAYTASMPSVPSKPVRQEDKAEYTHNIPVALGTPVGKGQDVVLSQARIFGEQAQVQYVQPLAVAHTKEETRGSDNKEGANHTELSDEDAADMISRATRALQHGPLRQWTGQVRGEMVTPQQQKDIMLKYEQERAKVLARAESILEREDDVRTFLRSWELTHEPRFVEETDEGILVHDLTLDKEKLSDQDNTTLSDRTNQRVQLSAPPPQTGPLSAPSSDWDTDASESFNPQDKANLGTINKRKPPLKAQGKHVEVGDTWHHLPEDLHATFQAYLNYGTNRGGGYDEQEWLRALHTWAPTKEEVTRYIKKKHMIPMDMDRLQCNKAYLKRFDNVPYPPPPLACIQRAFLENYFEVKQSTIKGAGLGLFVRTHRKDTGEPIVAVGPFTLFYEGTLRSKREDTDLSNYWRPRQGKYIEPDTTAMTYMINDCPLVNTPHAPLTNLIAVENHTGELRAEEPIEAGEELFVSYGPDYNWFPAWMTLTQKLYTELQALAKLEKDWAMKLTDEGFHSIVRAIKNKKLRDSVDRASLKSAGWGPAGEVHRDWEQWVDEFLLLWSVVTARYEPPVTTDARKTFPHCVLGVARFTAHFTFGLADHTSYVQYNRDDFKEVFHIMFRDRASYKQLQACKAYTSGPYIAQQKAMTAKRGESVMYIEWENTWQEGDFKDRVRMDKRQEKAKPVKAAPPKETSSESGTDDDYKRPGKAAKKSTTAGFVYNTTGYVYNGPDASQTPQQQELEEWEPVVKKGKKKSAKQRDNQQEDSEHRRVLNQLLGAAMSEGQDREVSRLLQLIDRLNEGWSGEDIMREAEEGQLSQVITSEEGSDSDSVTVLETPVPKSSGRSVAAAEKTAALKRAIMPAPVVKAAAAVPEPSVAPPMTPIRPPVEIPEPPRSPSMTPLRSTRSYSQAVTTGGRSARAQQAYVHSDKYYIRNTEIRYDFNLAAYEKGKRKSTLVQSERNIRVFSRTEDWPIEDWRLEWFTHAKSKNEHPHDLAMFLFGRSGFSPTLAQECLVSQQVGTSLTTAWQPASQDDVEDCWRWVEALVTFFFVKYRTMYTQQQVMARMMSLKLMTPDFEGLLGLWAAVLRWYKRLDKEGMAATDLVQIMIQAIQESPARPDLGLFGSLNVNAFTNAYNAELQLEENDNVETPDLIQKGVEEPTTENVAGTRSGANGTTSATIAAAAAREARTRSDSTGIHAETNQVASGDNQGVVLR